MKKTLAIATVATMIPFAAYAKSTISDNEMGTVTAQAGISFNANLYMDIHMDTLAWGDSNGLTYAGLTATTGVNTAYDNSHATGAGWVGFKNFDVQGLRLRPRQDYDFTAFDGSYQAPSRDGNEPILVSTMGTAGNYQLRFPSLDVATTTDDTLYKTGTTFVRFELGSMQVSMNSFDATVALGGNGTPHDATTAAIAAKNTANLTQEMGSIYMGNMQIYINSASYVDFYAPQGAGQQGVNIAFNVIMDKIFFDAISWGDKDGLANGTTGHNTTAGFIGLKNLYIDNFTMVGKLAIDVATVGTNSGSNSASTSATGSEVLAMLSLADFPTSSSTVKTAIDSLGAAMYNNMPLADGTKMAKTYVHFTLGTELGTVGTTGGPLVASATNGVGAGDWHKYGTTFNSLGNYSNGGLNTNYINMDDANVLKVGMGEFAADVVLASDKQLATGASTLGSIYMSNMTAKMRGWVDIIAH